MSRSVFCCTLCAFFVASLALAEEPARKADQLRTQLEEVQRQLEQLQRQEQAGSKVTEIGSVRGRTSEYSDARLIVRLYDLSDLFAVAPNYRAYEPRDLTSDSSPAPIFGGRRDAPEMTGSGGFGGGGFFAVADRTGGDLGEGAQAGRTSMEGLLHAITSTIDASSWKSGASTITTLGASLIVSTTRDNHQQIAALLDLFRKRWGTLRTISLQAHWLWLQPEQLLAAIEPVGPANEKTPFGSVPAERWKKLHADAEKNHPGYQAMLTCYNGQTVHAIAGGERLLISRVKATLPAAEANALREPVVLEPILQPLMTGAVLQVTPIATRNAKYVMLDVHSRVNEVSAAEGKPAAAIEGLEKTVAVIDRPVLDSQQLATTLRLPVATPTLVGGMTFMKSGQHGNLYLFITADVRELRDEEGQEVRADADSGPASEKKP